METPTLLDIAGGVAQITLNRPENKNALSVELVASLGAHLTEAIADERARVIVLTNTGNTFCAGADLKAARPGQSGNSAGNPAGEAETSDKPLSFVDVFELIIGSPKPVIGRIAGHVTGGGVGLAAVCDISVMIDDCLCGFTEVRIGVAPAVISVVCLPKLRRADALELFLTGERISGTRACAVGLVNHAVPAGELDDKVDEIVAKVIRGGPNALAASKQLVAEVPGWSRSEAFAETAIRSAALFAQPEATEGIAAFRERRDPAWIPSE